MKLRIEKINHSALIFITILSLLTTIIFLNASETKISPTDIDYNAFGYSVSIHNNYSVIGAHLDSDKDEYAGAAYVYYFNGVNWLQEDKIYASDGFNGDEFGRSVAIHNDYIIVGSHLDDDNGLDSGSA